MNQSETTRLISIIKSQYQHKFVIEGMTAITWHELLNQQPVIPFEAAKQAAAIWMRDNDWPPSVKDLRDIIATTICGIPTADEAWRDLQDWLKAGYPGMTVDRRPPLPPLVGETVKEIGGTSLIREQGDKARAKFDAAYNRRRREQVATTNVTEAWTALAEPERKAIA